MALFEDSATDTNIYVARDHPSVSEVWDELASAAALHICVLVLVSVAERDSEVCSFVVLI